MSKEHKVLPIDTTDDNMPGRYEESNFVPIIVDPKKIPSKSRGIYVGIVAFAIFSSVFFSYYFLNQNEIDSKIIQNSLVFDPEKKLVNLYGVGVYGSEHSHAALLIFIDGSPLDFTSSQFQLASKYIHFENHNPYLIHKHATGVPLEMLFSSLGAKVTEDCLILNYYSDTKTKFCSDKEKSLSFYVNGHKYNSNLSGYVIEHNDRILVSLGDGNQIIDQLEYLNSLKIFDVPKKTPKYSEDVISI